MREVGASIYRAEDWPHGLRCGACDRLFEEGDDYVVSPHAMLEETPIMAVVCPECQRTGKELLA